MFDLKKELESAFELTDLEYPTKIVRIEITQMSNSITIGQKQYILSILQSEGLEDADPVSAPLDTNVKLEPNPEGSVGDQSNLFTMLIAVLSYCNQARHSFAVNRLAVYTTNPSLTHYTAAKHILRYLKGTINLGLTY